MYAWCLRAAGWVVREVTNGAEAIGVAALFMPGVIIVDLQLPDLTESEVTHRLKTNERTRDIPIVAYSAYSTGDTADAQATARIAGCDQYFPKSAAPEALRALLDGLV